MPKAVKTRHCMKASGVRKGKVKRATPKRKFTKLSSEEIRLAREWYSKDIEPSEIATRLSRNKSTMTRLLVKQTPRLQQGRKPILTKADIDFLEKRLHELIVKANRQYDVTIAHLKRSTRCKASTRVMLNALHERKIYFRKRREKPILTADDVKARFAFAKKYRHKPTKFWTNMFAIDGKHFQAYLNGNTRELAAMHATYGAFRAPGKGLHGAYVKAKKGMRVGTGAKNILVIAAVGRGKVTMWHQVPDSWWTGEAAANMHHVYLVVGSVKPCSVALPRCS